MDNKDNIFASPLSRVGDFRFDAATAGVFDDMVTRSVPFYEEMQNMIVDLALKVAPDSAVIYDLGCSTGTTLLLLAARWRSGNPPQSGLRLVGLDSSEAMLARAEAKRLLVNPDCRIDWRVRDLSGGLEDCPADIFIMNLTLQFLRPLNREQLIADAYRNLNPGGCLILVEKVLADDTLFNRLYIELYHEFKKRNGYSELEISQKREALENVLIPYRVSENEEMLARNGFARTELFFRWFNFAGFVAMKL
jgi:tRNA (cmo5U34)-methyltransferase